MACAINLEDTGTINAERLTDVSDMIKRAARFVEQVYYPDLLAIASFYKDWAAIGGGTRNHLACGEFPEGGDIRELDRLYFPRGIILDGDLSRVHPYDPMKVKEYITSSWYEYPDGDASGLHPWEGETTPKYSGPPTPWTYLQDEKKYTWMKAPRYDGMAMQVGPLSRMLVAYGSGHEEARTLVAEVLGRLGVGPAALFSTLGRTAARGIETVLLARRMTRWYDDLISRVKSGDTRTFNGDAWKPDSWKPTSQGYGKLAAQLLRERFLRYLRNEALDQLGDAAVVSLAGAELAMSTDTFVVTPLEFPGGNIGSLAVHGTLNDLAMMGARPAFLSAGFVLEEGLELELLDRIVRSLGETARAAGVPLVTGDTKVVDRGKADGLFINTTGIGAIDPSFRPGPARAVVGDAVIVSGPIGRHGMAIMAAREGLGLDTELASDCATLWPLVERLKQAAGDRVHVLRDPTRGGVASALNEIAQASSVGFRLNETRLPVPATVRGACEMLGLDPLYVANEGILIAVLPAEAASAAVEALRAHPLGVDARIIGQAVGDHPGMVTMRTLMGGTRVVDLLPGDQLPRIC